jgi:hypothetical protein
MATGKVNWTNVYTPPIINNIERTVYWTNKERNKRPGGGEEPQATGNVGLATGNAKV